VELYLHSPDTFLWRGALLSTGTTLPLYLSLIGDIRHKWTNRAERMEDKITCNININNVDT